MKIIEIILDYTGKIALIVFFVATSLLGLTGAIALLFKVLQWGKEIL